MQPFILKMLHAFQAVYKASFIIEYLQDKKGYEYYEYYSLHWMHHHMRREEKENKGL